MISKNKGYDRKNPVTRLTAALLAGMLAVMSGCGNNVNSGNSGNSVNAETAAAGEETSGETLTGEAGSENAADSKADEAAAQDNDEEKWAELIPDMQTVAKAVDATIYQDGFDMDTEAAISVNGALIKGDYLLSADTKVLQDLNGEGLCMTGVTTFDMDDSTTRSYYRNGVYREENGDEIKEIEKTEEEVWDNVTEITDMVLEAGTSVEAVEITEKEGLSWYTYEVPGYIAEKYTKKIVKKFNVEQLDGASAEIEDVAISTGINDEGMAEALTLSFSGKVHKFIFSVPISVDLQLDFQSIDTIDFSDFDF